jgi:hypothetical protein
MALSQLELVKTVRNATRGVAVAYVDQPQRPLAPIRGPIPVSAAKTIVDALLEQYDITPKEKQ